MRLTCWKLSVAGLTFFYSWCYLIAMVSGGCICPSEPALWEVPCGSRTTRIEQQATPSSSEEIKTRQEIVKDGLKRIVTVSTASETYYSRHDFKIIFPTTEKNLNDRNNIPSWLPGTGDVNTIEIDTKSVKEIPKSLPTYYTHLQKFAIAFEQTIADHQNDDGIKVAIGDISTGLSSLLCEIKSTLEDLKISVPTTALRTEMPGDQRNMTADTDRDRRNVRDYLTVQRYREYVQRWATFLRRIKENRRRKRMSSSTVIPENNSAVRRHGRKGRRKHFIATTSSSSSFIASSKL